MTTPATYTGKDTEVWITFGDASEKTHSELAIGEISLTLDRGTIDRGLTGETGNYHTQGALSITGSLTSAKLSDDAGAKFVESIVSGTSDMRITISGNTGDDSLHFYFNQVMITNASVDMGDASTISDGSFDFQIMNPSDVTEDADTDDGVWVKCIG